MPRRCLLQAAHRRLPTTLDDGSLAARRRRLLQRAEGRVLDISRHWEDNLLAYRRGQVSELGVGGPRRIELPEGFPRPIVGAGLGRGPWDTVVATFALCGEDDPLRWLTRAGKALAPGGRILVLEHVGGTGLTGMLQRLALPVEIGLRSGCRLDLDVSGSARRAGLTVGDCARFTLWVGATVPAPCVAAVLLPRPAGPTP